MFFQLLVYSPEKILELIIMSQYFPWFTKEHFEKDFARETVLPLFKKYQ